MAGSESDSAGPLGTTENRLVNSDATARHEQKNRKAETLSCSEYRAAVKDETAVDDIITNNRVYKGLVKHTLVCLCLWFLVSGTLVVSCLQLLVLSPATP